MLCLSLGENCLPDDVLARHGLKAFSSPYPAALSTLDHALQLEEEGYRGLLDRDTLELDPAEPEAVVRNTRYRCDPTYHRRHIAGFGFAHHDPIGDESHRASFRRKIARLDGLRGRRDVCFLYHHRLNPHGDLDAIVRKAHRFARFYRSDEARCRVVIFTQELVASPAERGVVEWSAGDIGLYVVKTLRAWGGLDPEDLWARRDDDLLVRMLALAGLLLAEDVALAADDHQPNDPVTGGRDSA